MHFHLLKVCAGLIICFVLVECELTVENGGYSNVVVTFAPNVPSDKRNELVDNLQGILKNASEVLQAAIGLRFSKVTVVIPKSWDLPIEASYTTQNNLQSHILVEGINDAAFGKFPFAHQYGSCGTPGSQLTIPTEFLSEEFDFPKGTILAREWLKYRYGVFDENGYPDDELYPSFYSIPGTDPSEVKVTDCTNKAVIYSFIEKDEKNCSKFIEATGLPDASHCMPMPNEESLETVTSSLMFFQKQFHSMRDVCGKDEEHRHSSRSPNKQNTLCHGRSIWDVLKTSEDFKNVQAPENNEIEFEYLQEAYPRIVVTWDNTASMKPKGSPMFQAIRRFLYELPDGSKCAFLPFISTVVQGDQALRELSDWPNDRNINVESNFGAPGDGCISCAISKAAELLLSDEPESEGTIVAIVRSQLASTEELEKIRNSKLCLVFIVFNAEVLQKYTEHAESLPCGKVMDFSSVEGIEVFKKVYETMKTLLPETIDGTISETKSTKFVKGGDSISVPIHSTVKKVMFWIFYNLEMDAVELKLDDQEKNAELKLFRDSETFRCFSYSPQPEQTGILKFSIKYPDDEKFLADVNVILKQENYLSADVFIYDTTEKESTTQMPVIIYTSVRYGSYPVQYASVSVTVRRPDGHLISMEMYDDGKGDPDITKNDGIYSRYFIRFNQEGDYTVEVNVKNKEDLTKGGRLFFDKNEGFQTCCGSSLPEGSLPIPSFSKNFTTSFRAISGRPENGYKPSRVADLKMDGIDGDKVILKWSAPGAQADEGTVENYEVKYFPSREDAEQHFDKGNPLNVTLTPAPRGSAVTLEINLGQFEESALYYIAIRAISATGQNSDISNIIEVFIPDAEVTTSNEVVDDKEVKTASPDKLTIGIVIGIILAVVVLIILIYLVIYIVCLKPRRKKDTEPREIQESKMKNPSVENHVGKSSTDNHVNSINFIPAGAIMKNHKEIERAKAENKNPPIFREEDFEDRNSTASNMSGDNEEEPGYSQVKKISRKEEPIHPKSPKRTTCV